MGIINPRPALRAKGNRDIINNLKRHSDLTVLLTASGINKEEASRLAYNILRTSKERKGIWKQK